MTDAAALDLARALAAGTAPITTRVAVVVAHPDDESLGLGAQLGRLHDPLLVHVTDGAPRDLGDARAHGFASAEAYAAARRAELASALRQAGASAAKTVSLDLPDQAAVLHLADLARRLRSLFAEHRPDVVVTHPYEGGHPDHDAASLAVHATGVPVVEAAFYNAAAPPGPDALDFLPGAATGIFTAALDDERQSAKCALLACFSTQRAMLTSFPLSRERFRAAPRYDFTRPPHDGLLLYERFPWGATGPGWRALAAAALDELAR